MALAVKTYGHLEESPVFSEREAPLVRTETKRLTLGKALKFANGEPCELFNGRRIKKMPDNDHAAAQGHLLAELVFYLKARRIGWVLAELMLRLWPENRYEGRMPDLAIILNENLNRDETLSDTRAGYCHQNHFQPRCLENTLRESSTLFRAWLPRSVARGSVSKRRNDRHAKRATLRTARADQPGIAPRVLCEEERRFCLAGGANQTSGEVTLSRRTFLAS